MSGSDFLFAMPSFLSGMGRTLMIWEPFDRYNASKSPDEADAWALEMDAKVIGELVRALTMHPADDSCLVDLYDRLLETREGTELLSKAAMAIDA